MFGDGLTLLLARDALIKLPSPISIDILCVSGSVWITQHGYPGDVILGPGQSYEATGDRSLVLEALSCSTCLFDPRAPSPRRSLNIGWSYFSEPKPNHD